MAKRVPAPDALEKGLRLGCGGLLGLVVFGPLAYRLFDGGKNWWVLLVVGVAAFAFLALRYGDRFWISFASWWRSWMGLGP